MEVRHPDQLVQLALGLAMRGAGEAAVMGDGEAADRYAALAFRLAEATRVTP